MLRITPEITLFDDQIRERFVPQAGSESRPDARHATAVELRLDIHRATLPPEVKLRLLALPGRRVTAQGELVVVSRARGSQAGNRDAARQRLLSLVRAAALPEPVRLPAAPARRVRPPRTTGRSHTAQHRAVVGKLV